VATLDPQAIFHAAETAAMTSGLFERVNGHEPKSPPGAGLTAAVWVDRLGPINARSGLATTTVRVLLNARIYTGMTTEPQDAIDPRMLGAAHHLAQAWSGDFDLGLGVDHEVDLLGAHGVALEVRAGYVQVGNILNRVYTITVPLLINDAWDQVR
jgi:hypothetical protein